MKKFFEDQVANPQAWPSVDGGYYVAFSVACELYKRDEKLIKELVARFKLKKIEDKGFVRFML